LNSICRKEIEELISEAKTKLSRAGNEGTLGESKYNEIQRYFFKDIYADIYEHMNDDNDS